MRDELTPSQKLLLGILCGIALSIPGASAAAAGIDKQNFTQIERGHYLTIVGDCAACHTLPRSGHDFAGGRIVETPFGNLLAPNITPDPKTGIGAWTDDEFVNAMTKGTGSNGEHLYPAMPYTYYTKVTRDDALAIRAYLNTIPPVLDAVKADQLPFPINIRSTMAIWNKLFFTPGTFQPVAGKSAEWNRGAYLAEGLAHCGMCHTPKNILGADESSEKLQGYALQGWFAPDITNDSPRGLGAWSIDDLVAYLKTGHNQTSATAGLMSETLSLSTSHMTDADLKAIATYLKDQPGKQQSAPTASEDAILKSGAKIYADECSGCHTASGKGIPGMFPSLAGSAGVQQSDPTSLLHVVLRGARGTGTDSAPTAASMPAFSWVLKDDQVADVLTYIRNTWGNTAPPVSARDVSAARQAFAKRSD